MRRLLVVAGVALVTASTVLPAWGKGPVKATLKGPGLEAPLTFGGGERSGSDVMMLAESSGLFPALFFESPSPMKKHRPAKRLGTRYTVHYSIPAPAGGSATVTQYVYPFAAGGPITYTPPGQPFLEGERANGGSFLTHGGWYRAPSMLKSTLESAGLPSTPPRVSPEPPTGTPRSIWPVAGLVVLLGIAATSAAMRRRRWASSGHGAARAARWSRDQKLDSLD